MHARIKKMTTLLLVILSIALLLAGCNGGGSSTGTTAGTTAATTTTAAGGDETESPETTSAATEAAGIRSIEVFGMNINPNNTVYQWQNDYFEEHIGVNVTVIAGDAEKLTAMLASGDLPDIGRFAPNLDNTALIEGGLVLDLTPYEDRLSNYVDQFVGAVQFAKDEQSAGTGGFYGINFEMGTYDSYPVDVGTGGANVRWDLYEKAGKPAVTDMYSLLDAMKAIQEIYPETDDGLKTYAFGLHPEWDGIFLSGASKYTSLMGVYGGRLPYLDWDIANDKSDPVLAMGSAYYEGIKWLNTANRMGLLDPDSMTQTYAITQSKFNESEQYFLCMSGNYVDRYNTDERVNGEDPEGYMALVWDGQHPAVSGPTVFGDITNQFFVSAKTPEVDACIDFLNFLFDYDTAFTLFSGPRGELWDVVDGKFAVTDVGVDFAATNEHTFYTGETSTDWWGVYGYAMSTPHPEFGGSARLSNSVEFAELRIAENKICDMYEAFTGYRRPIQIWEENDALAYYPEWFKMLSAVPANLQDIIGNVSSVVKQDSWKIVMNATSDAEVDSMFQEMIDKCEAMNVQEVVDWGLAEYDAAQVKFAKYE